MKFRVMICGAVSTVVALVGTGTVAQECAYLGATENFNSIAYCVSSVLPSEGGNDYGPDNLFDIDPSTAWCEGARGNGVGEVITLRIDGGGPFRRFLIENGYGKSERIFSRNARPKTIEIRTDTGVSFRHVLEDRSNERWVELPGPDEYKVLQIRVIDVYPGTHYEDMCISTILLDFDYEKYLEWERESLSPAPAAPETSQSPAPEAPVEGTPEAPGFESLPELPKL